MRLGKRGVKAAKGPARRYNDLKRIFVASVEARDSSAGENRAGRKFNVQKSRSKFKVPASTAELSRYYSVYA
jgi:hypothetical protein